MKNILEINCKGCEPIVELNAELLSKEGSYLVYSWNVVFNGSIIPFTIGKVPNLTFVIEYKNGVYSIRRYSQHKIIESSQDLKLFEKNIQYLFIKEL